MNTNLITAMAALAALPALVQPAVASTALDKAVAMHRESLEFLGHAHGVLEELDSGKISQADAVTELNDLSAKLEALAAAIEKAVPKLSDADVQKYEKTIFEDDYMEDCTSVDDAIYECVERLRASSFLDNAALEKACERIMAAFPRG